MTTTQSPAHILIIDDEPEMAALAELALRAHGFDVSLSTSGEDGLRTVRAQRPDLVVLDVMMPDLDGFEVCRRMRADARTAYIPVLFLTALQQRDEHLAGLRAGGDDYLTKPYDFDEFLLRVQALLRRSTVAGLPKPEADVHISLLGPVRVEVGGELLDGFESQKALALLCYLAVQNQSVSRAQLAGLLWGNLPESRARGNLRRVLSNLSRLLPGSFESDRNHIRFLRGGESAPTAPSTWLDVDEFDAAASSVHTLEQAAALYRGDFLEGLHVRNCPEFELWLTNERSRRHLLALQVLHELIGHHGQRGEYNAGIEYATRLLALEPWREEAHRQLMLLLVHDGQRNAALAQYETCRKMLAEELGVEPSPETTALRDQLSSGQTPALQPRPAPRRHNLPAQTTRLFGREAELAQLREALSRPETRLLTLVGEGGVGKTRLALAAARRSHDHFSDGAWFIPLVGLTVSGDAIFEDALAMVIAGSLNLLLSGSDASWTQVMDYVREREILLVLDNFEHLLAGAGALLELLQAAPGVTLLVTSRQRLNLQTEHVLQLSGLPTPDPAAPDDALEYASVQLLAERAAHATGTFQFDAHSLREMARVCRLLAGNPLAIELAAVWTDRMQLSQMAAALSADLDFLATTMGDVPRRQRSLRAVFDQSWELLSLAEQAALAQASVFRGGFTREAAGAVIRSHELGIRDQDSGIRDQATDTTEEGPLILDPQSLIPDPGSLAPDHYLAALVNKSLLRRSKSGRYEMHELVAQFAAEKLRIGDLGIQIPERESKAAIHEPSAPLRTSLQSEIQNRHSAYYLDFVTQRAERLRGAAAPETLAELRGELGNIQQALAWAVAHSRMLQEDSSLAGFTHLAEIAGLEQEGERAIEDARARLERSTARAPDQEAQRARSALRIEQESFLEALSLLVGSRRKRQAKEEL